MASTKAQKLDALLQLAVDDDQAGRLPQAIDRLAEQADAFPKAPRLWGYLGFLHGENGDPKSAARAYRRTTEPSPRSELASVGLFHSLWRSKRADAAFDEMRRFVQRNDAPRYRELLRDMLAEPFGRQAEPGQTVRRRKVG